MASGSLYIQVVPIPLRAQLLPAFSFGMQKHERLGAEDISYRQSFRTNWKHELAEYGRRKMFALTFSKKHLRIQVYCRDGFHPKVLQFLFVWCCNARKLWRRFESFIAAFESLDAGNNSFKTNILKLHVAHCLN